MNDDIVPPWTPEQVAALNAWQRNARVHPMTCGTNSRHRALVATRGGWTCLDCDYRQTWAPRFMGMSGPVTPGR